MFPFHDCNTAVVEKSCDFSRYTQMGLMWVGESFYKTPANFIAESAALGVSKRIASLPVDLEPGKTWIALAHRKAIVSWSSKDGQTFPDYTPGVFMFFKVMQVQYVVTGQESAEELERKEKRGIQLVRIEQAGQQLPLIEKSNL